MKIAHISDIHFGKFSRIEDLVVPGTRSLEQTEGNPPFVESLINILKEEKVEYLIITGDLTSIGDPSEYYYCNKFLNDLIKSIGIEEDKVIITLGNHDFDRKIIKLSECYRENNEIDLEEVKLIYTKSAGSVANHCINLGCDFNKKNLIPFTGVKEYEDMIVFAMNSGWLCTGEESNKGGQVSEDQLYWFRDKILEYKNINKFKILTLHHHLFNYPYPTIIKDSSTLKEGAELLELIGKEGIDLVLHGHRHDPKVRTVYQDKWSKPVTFICAGSLAVNSKYRQGIPNTCHIIEINKENYDILLKNYQLHSIVGWQPVTYDEKLCKLDDLMLIGILCNDEEYEASIAHLCKIEDKEDSHDLPAWENLDRILRSRTYNQLNQYIERYCESIGCYLYGKYPDKNLLIKRK